MDTLPPEVPQDSVHPAAPAWAAKADLLAGLSGVLAALRSIVITVGLAALVLTPVVVVDSNAAFGAKALFDTTTWGWLLMNGAPPKLGAATFTLIPWGLAIIPWFLNFFGARTLTAKYRLNPRLLAVATSLAFITYVSSVVFAAAFVDSINVSFSVWSTLIVSVLVTGSALLAGVVSGLRDSIAIPPILKFILARGVAVVFAIFGIGALFLVILLLANFSDVLFLFNQLNPGYSGFLALTLVSLGYLPVLTVWTMAYVTGAGFSIGPEVMVSPFIPVTAPTQLPPFPPLAVLPETAGAVAWLLPALVIVLGVVWGIGVSVRMSRESVLMRLVIAVAIAVVAAVITMGLAALSTGNLGDVRLVELGPDPTLMGSLTWLLLTVGMIPAAVIPARMFTRKKQVVISVVKTDEAANDILENE
jgi:Family of unknown function (DUF6350)